jgi:hypothetical protein
MRVRLVLYLFIVLSALVGTIMYQDHVIRAQRAEMRAIEKTYCGLRPYTRI